MLRRERRRARPADLLVVGLGNPGRRVRAHAPQRRRRGRRAPRARGTAAGCKKGKERALVDEVRVGGKRVALAVPLTYMNDSGHGGRRRSSRRFGVEPEQLVIVHDELDLPARGAEGEGRRRARRPQRAALDQAAPAHRRVPARAHRRRQAGVEGAAAPTTCSTVRQARARPRSTSRSRRPPTRSS